MKTVKLSLSSKRVKHSKRHRYTYNVKPNKPTLENLPINAGSQSNKLQHCNDSSGHASVP